MVRSAALFLLSIAVAGAAPPTSPSSQPAAPAKQARREIEIASALVKLIEQADVPAREAGVLAAVNVREGQMVEEGEVLAQIVDTEARIA